MDICKEFYTFYAKNLFLSVNLLGFTLNILCIIAFCHSNQLRHNKSNIFKYLLIKSISDAFILSRNIVFKLFGNHFILFLNIQSCIITIIYEYYVGRVALLLSMMCEVATNFDRFRTIANRFLFLNKISFWIKFNFIILYCLLYYSYVFFQDQCFEITANTTLSYNITSTINYDIILVNSFKESRIGQFLRFFHSFFRDCFLIVLIVILNISTLVFMRNSFQRKRTMSLTQTNNKKPRNKNAKLEKAEKNLTLMVFSSSLVNIIGHFVQFLWFLPIYQLKSSECLNEIGTILLYLSYSINFFVYYSFNKHFKFYFNHYLIKILKTITFNRIKLLSKTKYETSNFSQT